MSPSPAFSSQKVEQIQMAKKGRWDNFPGLAVLRMHVQERVFEWTACYAKRALGGISLSTAYIMQL